MMAFDTFESTSLDGVPFDLGRRLTELRAGFESNIRPYTGVYFDVPEIVGANIAHWAGIDVAAIPSIGSSAFDTVKQMYRGTTLENGEASLSLEVIGKRFSAVGKDSPYYNQILKQQSGWTAEIVSTAKENLQSRIKGTGERVFRADDLPSLFEKNDPYVDKVRMDSAGNIIERIQVKFVGKDAGECLSRLTSKKLDKYFTDGKVDSIEIPKDYYPGVLEKASKEIGKLEQQLIKADDSKVVQGIERKIARLEQIKEMVKPSTVSSSEAMQATRHPLLYTSKLFMADKFGAAHGKGLEGAALAASLTVAVSTVDNVTKVFNSEISPQEAFIDVAKDTGTAGGIAYGTTFISTVVSHSMESSSHTLIKSLGSANVPASVIAFGVQSFDSVVDFAQGTIDGSQLAYDLGGNAAQVAGGAIGSAAAGAVVGSVAPGAGTAVGFGVGLVGGMIGCAVASEAYASAVQFGLDNADVLADKAQELADQTVELASEAIPNSVGNIIASFNEFASSNNLPISV